MRTLGIGLLRRAALMAATMTMLGITLAPTVSAATPSIIREMNASFSFAVADCGSFQIVGDWLVNTRLVTFFDASGTPIREDYSAHWNGVIANSVTGKSIDDSGSFSNVTNLLTGELHSSGVVRHDTAAGLGVLWQDAGLVIVDGSGNVTFSSAHTLADPAAACAYFQS